MLTLIGVYTQKHYKELHFNHECLYKISSGKHTEQLRPTLHSLSSHAANMVMVALHSYKQVTLITLSIHSHYCHLVADTGLKNGESWQELWPFFHSSPEQMHSHRV